MNIEFILAILGAVLLCVVATLYILILANFPLSNLVMGGKMSGKKLKIMCAISLPIQLFASVILLQLGGFFAFVSDDFARIFGWIFAIYFSLNVLGNLFSKSRKERILMTPLAVMIALSFWVVIL
jgi:hypothetical protein